MPKIPAFMGVRHFFMHSVVFSWPFIGRNSIGDQAYGLKGEMYGKKTSVCKLRL